MGKESPEQILARYANPEVPVRVRTAIDLDPLGYAAAMAPAFVDRAHGDFESDSILLRNVNHGGNPVEGSTALCSARLDVGALESAELCLVPLDTTVPGGAIHHVQIRFAFREGRHPQLLGVAGSDLGSDNTIPDLICSWEAWRAPGAGYSVLSGLDPKSYDLCLRVFSGPQRFLEDALGRRDWYSYPLRMPGGQDGLAELFRVVIALGDGLARATATRRIEEMGETSPSWEAMREFAAPIEDTYEDVPEELQSYQTLLRSCGTVALHSITVALDRLKESGHVDGVDWDKVPRSPVDESESWMSEVAHAGLGGVARVAPRALKYLISHPAAVPSRIPDLLRAAGVVESGKGGRAVKHHYSLGGNTPYGELRGNLIR